MWISSLYIIKFDFNNHHVSIYYKVDFYEIVMLSRIGKEKLDSRLSPKWALIADVDLYMLTVHKCCCGCGQICSCIQTVCIILWSKMQRSGWGCKPRRLQLLLLSSSRFNSATLPLHLVQKFMPLQRGEMNQYYSYRWLNLEMIVKVSKF